MHYLSGMSMLLRFAIEIVIAFFNFAEKPRKKSYFALRICVCSACVLAAIFCLPVSGITKTVVGQTVALTVTLCLLFILLWQISDTVLDAVFWFVMALITRNIAANTFQILERAVAGTNAAEIINDGTVGGMIIHYAIFFTVYFLEWFFVGKRVRKLGAKAKDIRRFLPVFISTAVTMLLLTEIDVNLADRLARVTSAVLQVLYGIVMLYLYYSILREIKFREEAAAMAMAAAMESKQFELLKESMSTISVKSHDLKHQIARTKETGDIPIVDSETQAALTVFDGTFNTGNATLDIILTDRCSRCVARNIEFTCIADAEKLAFMSPEDVYSLFCNAIDNAIEYEETLADNGNRYIHLSIKHEESFLCIHLENYYEGECRGGQPETTKVDKNLHGYGTKSIKRVVERYGGTATFNGGNGAFELNALIPLT